MLTQLHNADSLEWLDSQPDNTFHALVTDPPFGIEYTPEHLEKLRKGSGGKWRVPSPGRKAAPRFTELKPLDLKKIQAFFEVFSQKALRVLRPGAHIFIASNPIISPWMFNPFLGSFERRGEVIRRTQTLRGGDRPKGAEEEYRNITVMPRSCYEPWGLFRKPLSEKTVAQNLRKWGTGGLRRIDNDTPFKDILDSEFPTKEERAISSHPSLKPQSLMRVLVRAALPEGGVVLDPFAGSGSTLAAAEALGFQSVGVEKDLKFYRDALESIPKLAALEDLFREQEIFEFAMSCE